MDFKDWHKALHKYSDVEAARTALYEAARRSPPLHVTFAYGTLVNLIGKSFDHIQATGGQYEDNGRFLAWMVYNTFALLTAMRDAYPERDLPSVYPVREDIVAYFDNFLLSHG